MTWLDLVTLGAFALFLSLAYKRGVILEVADLLCILVGGFFAFRMFRPISEFLHSSVFSGFSITFLERFSLFVVFIIVCLVVFSVALNFQRKTKEEKVLDRDVDEKLGVAVGFVKACIVIMLGLGFLFYNDAFPSREQRKLKNGAIVSALLGMSGVVRPIVYIVAPSDLAKEFMIKGLGPFREPKP
jgi:uncharacterized membrane protein required for colicin V production